jgi:hypothetical protein
MHMYVMILVDHKLANPGANPTTLEFTTTLPTL